MGIDKIMNENELGIFLKEDRVLVSSLTVAEKYGKRHDNVFRDIKNIIKDVPDVALNFEESSYINSQNKRQPCYEMDRQGFSMLVMGFTGVKAKRFTYEYTQAFEMMLNELHNNRRLHGLSPQLQLLINLEIQQNQIKKDIRDTNEKLDRIRDIVALNPSCWRQDTTDMINVIALKVGGFEYIKNIRNEIYALLEQRYGVSLKVRLTNKKKAMALNGASKHKIDKVTQLDVISDDKKLIEGFISIVKEVCIKYGA